MRSGYASGGGQQGCRKRRLPLHFFA
jgi:hypothetical protein